jgi:hypothetical protein
MLCRREYNYWIQAVRQAVVTCDFDKFHLRYLAHEIPDSMEGSNPFLTSGGRLGLESTGPQTDDVIVVFVGIETPWCVSLCSDRR